MLASLRTYRSLAALLAAVLLAGVTLPLVQHACAAVGQRAAMAACCCKHEGAAAPAHHHGPDRPHHTAAYPAAQDAACQDAPLGAPRASASAQPECCTLQPAQRLPEAVTLSKQVELLGLPMALALAAVVLPAPVPAPASPLFDTGPPLPPPVPLHLLHAALLR